MASGNGFRTAFGAGAAAALLGMLAAALPSGCFLTTSGLPAESTSTSTSSGHGGTGGTGGTGGHGGHGGTTTSSTSSTGGGCNADGDCAPDVCTSYSCQNHVCVPAPLAAGKPCNTQAGFCDDKGACHPCIDQPPAGCAAGQYCYQDLCASCTDTQRNGDESDTDCGGTHCPLCDDGKTCAAAADCKNMQCNKGKCVNCTDGKRGGDETDVDCGGSCPTGCANGKGCNIDGDCASAHCINGICCDMPCTGQCASCTMQGYEGSCVSTPVGLDGSPSCGNNKVCGTGGTCQNLSSKKADGAICNQSSDCFNGVCAGLFCKLQNGDICSIYMDCASGRCAQGKCAACATNADCPESMMCQGGTCLLPAGSFCAKSSDCANNTCNSNSCAKPNNQPCTTAFDCLSHLCKGGMCSSCTTTDCASCNSGTCLAPTGQPCISAAQCASGVCTGWLFKVCQ